MMASISDCLVSAIAYHCLIPGFKLIPTHAKKREIIDKRYIGRMLLPTLLLNYERHHHNPLSDGHEARSLRATAFKASLSSSATWPRTSLIRLVSDGQSTDSYATL